MQQRRWRWWLIIGIALIGLKLAITALWVAEHHHILPIPGPATDETLWWITKVSPPLFVAAFAMDARQIGNRTYERLFIILLVITIVYGSVVTYAMLHGWRGTPL